MGAIISDILKDSIAEELEFEKGDELVSSLLIKYSEKIYYLTSKN